ncbi:MAG: ABC transporter permease [Gammaproteobacteria bacterium]|nr:ABC transporter permease [Gammaproteobacteria bacterium]
MYLHSLVKQILKDMWAWKLRSFLALFGIMWGTITVIMLLALGTGFSTEGQKSMLQIVDGTFFVIPDKTSISYRGYPKGQTVNLKSRAIMGLKTALPKIKMVSPGLVTRTFVGYGKQRVSKELFGVSSAFGVLRKVNIQPGGRFVNPLDVKQKNKVAVIGDKVQEQLFGARSPIGRHITINNVEFTVIGVTQPARKNVYNWYKNKVVIPYTKYIDLFGNQNNPFFVVYPDPNADSLAIQKSLRTYFAGRYHFAPNDKFALRIFDTTKIFQFMRWFFIGIQLFLGICGTITLGVGSLGVANIMFLIVSERTKEIGIRMAIGAKDWQILLQVILEALILVCVGGIMGFLVSYIATVILQHAGIPEWLGKPQISVTAAVVTIIIIAILGVIAGYFPARRAAKMDPVEALGL